MPIFSYKALKQNGKTVRGLVDADCLSVAKDLLRKQNIYVVSMDEDRKHKKTYLLTEEEVLEFTRELSQLLNGKLPLYESLLTIEEKRRGTQKHFLFADLCDLLRNGTSLSESLKKYRSSFNEVYRSVVIASEKSGSLDLGFRELTELLNRQKKLKKQLISALAYPAFLGCFCLVIVMVLFFYIIPSMKELFEGRRLHILTQTVISISDFLLAHGLKLFCLISFGSIAFFLLQKISAVRRCRDRWILKIPFFGVILLESAFVRFFRTMQMLLRGGVPLMDALGFAKQGVKKSLIIKCVESAEQGLAYGEKMSHTLSKHSVIPPLVIRMLTIGEQSGQIDKMMESLAIIYEEELDKHLGVLATFLQPIVLLVLGLVVGVVVLSILLPLTDVSSFVSS